MQYICRRIYYLGFYFIFYNVASSEEGHFFVSSSCLEVFTFLSNFRLIELRIPKELITTIDVY